MISKEAIDAALVAHGLWKGRLMDAIQKGTSEFKVEVVEKDNQCQFGKWMYELTSAEQNSENYKKVRELHAAFHKMASEILDLALKGKKEEALKNMEIGGQYNRLSGKLVMALSEWKKTIG